MPEPGHEAILLNLARLQRSSALVWAYWVGTGRFIALAAKRSLAERVPFWTAPVILRP